MASRSVKRILPPKRVWVGVTEYSVLSGVEAIRLGVAFPSGLVMRSLHMGGPLQAAGVQIDDILYKINGMTLGVHPGEFSPSRILSFLETVDPITVSIKRGAFEFDLETYDCVFTSAF